MNKKVLFFSILLTCMYAKAVKLPSEETMRNVLKDIVPTHFFKNTVLFTELADKDVKPYDVYMVVYWSIEIWRYKYFVSIAKEWTVSEVQDFLSSHEKIVRTILKDDQECIKELEEQKLFFNK